ncbi:DUF6266 family protein [Pedobacter sp. R20-19]|uniref:DUF6266 family protein n=1 Tax=Pedobacter sp. R20-19 TaxID=1270196 RepID=UPI0004933A69|nr:DUF6266 family protein [Pedobacter sp. R20-19]
MGAYSKGANGTFSGKVGSVIGSSWRSIDYIRSLPKKSSKEATKDQVAQRTKFAMAPVYLRPIKDILNIGFGDKNLNKTTGYNAAVKIFLTQAIQGDYPNFNVDFSKIVMSKGSLSVFHSLAVTLTGSDLVLTWQSILNRYNAFSDDSLMVMVFNETKMMYLIYEDMTRIDLTYTINMGTDFSGDVLYIWAFAIKREGDIVGNSQYLGTVTLP